MDLPLVSINCRLPTEVLCHIFIHSLPQTDYTSPIQKSPPILLTRICRRWREIVVNVPSLWCRLSIIHSLPQTDYTSPIPKFPPILLTRICRRWREIVVNMPSSWCRLFIDQTNLQQWLFCYDSWLKRTQGHPLSLEIICVKTDTAYLRTLLQPYVHQISSLNITFDEAFAPEIVLDDLSALQKLRIVIRGINNPVYNTALSISPPISRLSTLHTLEFEGRFFLTPDLISRLHPVWAHLTNLTIDLCKHRDVIRLLQLAPNLSTFKIHIVYIDYMNGGPLEPLIHTSIQSLSITSTSSSHGHRLTNRHRPDAFVHLLTALVLPKLHVLNLGARSWTGDELKAVGTWDLYTRIGC